MKKCCLVKKTFFHYIAFEKNWSRKRKNFYYFRAFLGKRLILSTDSPRKKFFVFFQNRPNCRTWARRYRYIVVFAFLRIVCYTIGQVGFRQKVLSPLPLGEPCQLDRTGEGSLNSLMTLVIQGSPHPPRQIDIALPKGERERRLRGAKPFWRKPCCLWRSRLVHF